MIIFSVKVKNSLYRVNMSLLMTSHCLVSHDELLFLWVLFAENEDVEQLFIVFCMSVIMLFK